jgi:hypothetical protein
MRFEHALAKLRDGEPVRRESWAPGAQVHLANGAFHWTDDNGQELYDFSTDDILAGDWEAVNLDMVETPLEPKFEASPVDPFE